jgi:transposase InsO family protein
MCNVSTNFPNIDQQWQMDLADMQSMQKFNDGYRYLLVCIDVFSKYAWVVPLKNKTGPTLVEAFKVILTSGRKPEKIMTDQGTEFLNKHFRALMKEEDIELYNTYNETKASIVERLIRTSAFFKDSSVVGQNCQRAHQGRS